MARNPANRYQTAEEFLQALALYAMAEPGLGGTISAGQPRTTAFQTLPETSAFSPSDDDTTIAWVNQDADAPNLSALPLSLPTPVPEHGTITGFDAALLKAMESTLTRQLGPVARLLVRRAATAAHDEADLLKRLAVHLGSQEERDLFLANSGKLTAARAALEAAQTRTLPLGVAPVKVALTADSSGSQATVLATQAQRNNQTAAAESLGAAFLEQARECVARRVGPIAKIMVRKAAAQASGRAAFIEALCAQCDDAGDRAALARELRGL